MLEWTAAGKDVASVRVRLGDLEQTADLHLDPEGRPVRIVFPRWSNENPDKVFRVQPFGGDLGEIGRFDGYNLPTRVDGGNHYGTEDYHPFFRARLKSVRHAPPG